jgi:hypothetical protein
MEQERAGCAPTLDPRPKLAAFGLAVFSSRQNRVKPWVGSNAVYVHSTSAEEWTSLSCGLRNRRVWQRV